VNRAAKLVRILSGAIGGMWSAGCAGIGIVILLHSANAVRFGGSLWRVLLAFTAGVIFLLLGWFVLRNSRQAAI